MKLDFLANNMNFKETKSSSNAVLNNDNDTRGRMC